jgi:nucleotide-binding universal stress UspA family protein
VCAWSEYVPGEIVELAETLDASMIAMGTHGRTGLARVALGSVTMAVAHRAPCPVLTVRPAHLDGYASGA